MKLTTSEDGIKCCILQNLIGLIIFGSYYGVDMEMTADSSIFDSGLTLILQSSFSFLSYTDLKKPCSLIFAGFDPNDFQRTENLRSVDFIQNLYGEYITTYPA